MSSMVMIYQPEAPAPFFLSVEKQNVKMHLRRWFLHTEGLNKAAHTRGMCCNNWSYKSTGIYKMLFRTFKIKYLQGWDKLWCMQMNALIIRNLLHIE